MKKFLSILLALAMCLSLCAGMSFAAEEEVTAIYGADNASVFDDDSWNDIWDEPEYPSLEELLAAENPDVGTGTEEPEFTAVEEPEFPEFPEFEAEDGTISGGMQLWISGTELEWDFAPDVDNLPDSLIPMGQSYLLDDDGNFVVDGGKLVEVTNPGKDDKVQKAVYTYGDDDGIFTEDTYTVGTNELTETDLNQNECYYRSLGTRIKAYYVPYKQGTNPDTLLDTAAVEAALDTAKAELVLLTQENIDKYDVTKGQWCTENYKLLNTGALNKGYVPDAAVVKTTTVAYALTDKTPDEVKAAGVDFTWYLEYAEEELYPTDVNPKVPSEGTKVNDAWVYLHLVGANLYGGVAGKTYMTDCGINCMGDLHIVVDKASTVSGTAHLPEDAKDPVTAPKSSCGINVNGNLSVTGEALTIVTDDAAYDGKGWKVPDGATEGNYFRCFGVYTAGAVSLVNADVTVVADGDLYACGINAVGALSMSKSTLDVTATNRIELVGAAAKNDFSGYGGYAVRSASGVWEDSTVTLTANALQTREYTNSAEQNDRYYYEANLGVALECYSKNESPSDLTLKNTKLTIGSDEGYGMYCAVDVRGSLTAENSDIDVDAHYAYRLEENGVIKAEDGADTGIVYAQNGFALTGGSLKVNGGRSAVRTDKGSFAANGTDIDLTASYSYERYNSAGELASSPNYYSCGIECDSGNVSLTDCDVVIDVGGDCIYAHGCVVEETGPMGTVEKAQPAVSIVDCDKVELTNRREYSGNCFGIYADSIWDDNDTEDDYDDDTLVAPGDVVIKNSDVTISNPDCGIYCDGILTAEDAKLDITAQHDYAYAIQQVGVEGWGISGTGIYIDGDSSAEAPCSVLKNSEITIAGGYAGIDSQKEITFENCTLDITALGEDNDSENNGANTSLEDRGTAIRVSADVSFVNCPAVTLNVNCDGVAAFNVEAENTVFDVTVDGTWERYDSATEHVDVKSEGNGFLTGFISLQDCSVTIDSNGYGIWAGGGNEIGDADVSIYADNTVFDITALGTWEESMIMNRGEGSETELWNASRTSTFGDAIGGECDIILTNCSSITVKTNDDGIYSDEGDLYIKDCALDVTVEQREEETMESADGDTESNTEINCDGECLYADDDITLINVTGSVTGAYYGLYAEYGDVAVTDCDLDITVGSAASGEDWTWERNESYFDEKATEYYDYGFGSASKGIYADEDLVITNSTLDVKGCYGAEADGAIVIDGSTVNVSGQGNYFYKWNSNDLFGVLTDWEESGNGGEGIEAGVCMTVNNSTVNVDADQYGIYVYDPDYDDGGVYSYGYLNVNDSVVNVKVVDETAIYVECGYNQTGEEDCVVTAEGGEIGLFVEKGNLNVDIGLLDCTGGCAAIVSGDALDVDESMRVVESDQEGLTLADTEAISFVQERYNKWLGEDFAMGLYYFPVADGGDGNTYWNIGGNGWDLLGTLPEDTLALFTGDDDPDETSYNFMTYSTEPISFDFGAWAPTNAATHVVIGTGYGLTVRTPANGTLTVDDYNPGEGQLVTVFAEPDAMYELGTITVKASNGEAIELIANEDGSVSFVMPACSVTVSATFVEKAMGTYYDDVAESDWFYDYVMALTDMGVISGYANGRTTAPMYSFKPDASITRAEVVTMLALHDGIEDDGVFSDGVFYDVKADDWFAPYIAWAYENNIAYGDDNGCFRPNATVTRQELAALLARYAAYKGIDLATGSEKEFADNAAIAEWASEDVYTLQAAGIITGYADGTFRPEGEASRAETATMLALLIK